MITPFTSTFLRSRRFAAYFTSLLGLCGLVLGGPAQASVPSYAPSSAIAGDTFSIEVVGYNSADLGGAKYIAATTLAPTFGGTQSFTNSALNGQTLTVFSSESTTSGVTTDTVIVSVPDNFVPAGVLDQDGNTINSLLFEIGTYYGGTDTLDFSSSISGSTSTGALTYHINGNPASLASNQHPAFTNGGLSYSNYEAFTTPNTSGAATPVTNYDVTSFSVTITYTAVPEPSTWAAVALGVAGLGWLTVVRRRHGRA